MAEGLHHVRVVLVRPQQPPNIGTAARAIANHGLGGLTLVDPVGFDPERARWLAPNAHAIIDGAQIVGTVAEAVADMGRVIGTSGRWRRWPWPRWGPGQLCEQLLDDPVPTAIVFGPEDAGLANEDLEQADAILVLPTAEHASVNLGQSVTLVAGMLMAAQAGRQPVAAPPPLAPVQMRARVVDEALELLQHTGYLDGRSPEQVSGTLTRLLGRARPDQTELAALLGMLKSLRYPLGLHRGRRRASEAELQLDGGLPGAPLDEDGPDREGQG